MSDRRRSSAVGDVAAVNRHGRRVKSMSQERFRFAPRGVSYVLMIGWFVLIVAPLFWLTLTSLRSVEEYRDSSIGFPASPRWENYAEAWERANFAVYVPNSAIYTVSIVLGTLVFASLAGYGFAKFQFRGRTLILSLYVLALTIPFTATMFSVYDLTDAMGLLGTRAGVIIPTIAGGMAFSTLYMRAFFQGIPQAVTDAAKVDGAGELAIFLRIMVPLARPGLSTLAVFQGIWSWCMYLQPLLLAAKSELRTVALGLDFLTGEYGGTNQPLVAAAIVIIVGPLVVVSILLQRKFVEGMTIGSVK